MTGVQRFTKRPVTIEAMRLEAGIFPTDDSSSLDPNTRSHALIAGWMIGNGFRDFAVIGERAPFGLAISTLEGEMTAAPGDWIIKGVKGEFYPCKPDIFEATYDAAELPNLDREVLMEAWALLANVSEGDWTQQTPEWQEAVTRWRDDRFHPLLDLRGLDSWSKPGEIR